MLIYQPISQPFGWLYSGIVCCVECVYSPSSDIGNFLKSDLCVFRKICFILKLGLPVAAVPGALSPLAIPNAAAAAAAAAAGRVGMPGVSAGGNTVLLVSNLNEEVSETILLCFPPPL